MTKTKGKAAECLSLGKEPRVKGCSHQHSARKTTCYATERGQLPRDSHLRGRKSSSILAQAAKLIKFPAVDLSYKAGLPGLLYRPGREGDSIVSMGLVWTANLDKDYFPKAFCSLTPAAKLVLTGA